MFCCERSLDRTMLRRALVPAALLLVLCSSCVTSALWEADPDDTVEVDVALKLLLTPITLLVDLCTYPLQEWWHEDDVADDC